MDLSVQRKYSALSMSRGFVLATAPEGHAKCGRNDLIRLFPANVGDFSVLEAERFPEAKQMIYSPHSLLKLVREGKLIKHLAHRELTTPEGVGFDLRLAGLSRLTVGGGSLRESTRRTPASEVMLAAPDDCFIMEPGKTYLASTMEEFDLPEDLAALFFPRSTLFRSGITFSSSVLPPGYVGPMTFALTNHHCEAFEIQIGARFAHVIFQAVSGDIGRYKGQWQGGRVSQPKDEGQI